MTELLRFLRRRAGQATIEFALTLPLLLILSVGLFDLGRAVWSSNVLSTATREGARYAIVRASSCDAPCSPASVADIQAEVRRAALGIQSPPTVAVSYSDPAQRLGSTVTVDATAQFVPIASQFLLGDSLQLTLRSGTTMVIR